MDNSKPITNLSLPLTDAGGNGKKFDFRRRRIGESIGLHRLGCSLYVVPPGKVAFPYHAHSLTEEMVIVVEGSGTLRQEGRKYPIEAGDVIAAPVGEAHQIINTSDADLRYLCISTAETVDVVTYPDSGKVGAYSEAYGDTLWHMSRLGDATDYYDGEE